MNRNLHQYARFKAPRHIPLSHANDNNPPGGSPPKGPRPVEKLTDAELMTLEGNFVEKGVTVSRHYALKDVRRELLRRATKGIDGGEVVRHILELAAKSSDCLTTYGALFMKLWPSEEFVGNGSVGRVMKALGAAILYGVQHGLPCVTTLVVQANGRRLSERAAANIHATVKGLGVDVADDIEDYILAETLAAMDLVDRSAMQATA